LERSVQVTFGALSLADLICRDIVLDIMETLSQRL
jgi:hypothetical protein